jgi:hypothetical protein
VYIEKADGDWKDAGKITRARERQKAGRELGLRDCAFIVRWTKLIFFGEIHLMCAWRKRLHVIGFIGRTPE